MAREAKMGSHKTVVKHADPDGNWLYRVGGISGLFFGAAYLVIIALYMPIGARPDGVGAQLEYFAAHTGVWWGILGLSVLTDILLAPLALALYQALKGIHKSAMLLAVVFMGFFIILDLAITWTNYAVMIALANSYTAATDEAARAAVAAAAIYPSAVLESSILYVYNTLTLSIGILITGVVMLRGVFGRGTAYLGLSTGVMGSIAVLSSLFVAGLDFTIILASLLTMLWALFVGFSLYRLGRK
jgi:hypothetical protein